MSIVSSCDARAGVCCTRDCDSIDMCLSSMRAMWLMVWPRSVVLVVEDIRARALRVHWWDQVSEKAPGESALSSGVVNWAILGRQNRVTIPATKDRTESWTPLRCTKSAALRSTADISLRMHASSNTQDATGAVLLPPFG